MYHEIFTHSQTRNSLLSELTRDQECQAHSEQLWLAPQQFLSRTHALSPPLLLCCKIVVIPLTLMHAILQLIGYEFFVSITRGPDIPRTTGRQVKESKIDELQVSSN